MGLRLTSVGAEGGHRGSSLKLGAVSKLVEAPDVVSTATIKVEIQGENASPVAEDNVYGTDQDTEVLGNFVTDEDEFNGTDSDPDGDDLTVTEVVVNGAAIAFDTPITVTTDDGLFSGTLVVSDDGSYTFTPSADMVALGGMDHT